jgi:hypothetical protein
LAARRQLAWKVEDSAMLEKFDSLSRHMVGNRRGHRRRPIKYDTIVRDETGRKVFSGKTIDLSQTGAKISGFVTGPGLAEGQPVRVDFLVLPKDQARPASRALVKARISRVEETDDSATLAVMFDELLPG